MAYEFLKNLIPQIDFLELKSGLGKILLLIKQMKFLL